MIIVCVGRVRSGVSSERVFGPKFILDGSFLMFGNIRSGKRMKDVQGEVVTVGDHGC
jgi:hypothetical protein